MDVSSNSPIGTTTPKHYAGQDFQSDTTIPPLAKVSMEFLIPLARGEQQKSVELQALWYYTY